MVRTLISQTPKKIDSKVKLQGFVNSIRSHGKIVFVDLRDLSGIVQLVGGKELLNLKNEYIIEVEGLVKNRPLSMTNPNIPTGQVEIGISNISILNISAEMPLPIDTLGYEIDESVRLKYRYLDLRRQRMTQNIRLRSSVTHFIRNWLIEQGFVEIETPILTKTTPEGARDFIVPSRIQRGKFYALPQSPQQYKQLLMVAGFEKYFQLARCFRDEDPRHDRAYGEFTQLDMEMSFVTQNDILNLTEDLFTCLVKQLFPSKHITKTPWPRISHADAIKEFGNDKPDLRCNKKDPNEFAFTWIVDFPLFKKQSADDFYFGSGSAKFAPSHHMFTSPHPDDLGLLDTNPIKVRGLQHDLSLNGYEVGGGSIRIHDAKIQEKVFNLIGFNEHQKQQFSHLLKAFSYGVPPHGGIAPGIDRFLMVVLGEPSLREVVAFPAISSGAISVMDAPSVVSGDQLNELGISVNTKNAQKSKK